MQSHGSASGHMFSTEPVSSSFAVELGSKNWQKFRDGGELPHDRPDFSILTGLVFEFGSAPVTDAEIASGRPGKGDGAFKVEIRNIVFLRSLTNQFQLLRTFDEW